MVRTGVLIF
jgi:hypothetical protein